MEQNLLQHLTIKILILIPLVSKPGRIYSWVSTYRFGGIKFYAISVDPLHYCINLEELIGCRVKGWQLKTGCVVEDNF